MNLNTLPHDDRPQNWSADSGLSPWLAAYRGLGSNPLLARMREEQRLRRQQVPVWLRILLPLGLIVVGALFVSDWYRSQAHWLGYAALLRASSVVLAVFYLAWLVQGLVHAVPAAFTALERWVPSPGGQGSNTAGLDELDHHQTAIALLAPLWPPLALRAAIGSIVAYIYYIITDYISNTFISDYEAHNIEINWRYLSLPTTDEMLNHMAALAPLVLLAGVLSALAALALVLALVCLGRGLDARRGAVGITLIVLISQVVGPVLLFIPLGLCLFGVGYNFPGWVLLPVAQLALLSLLPLHLLRLQASAHQHPRRRSRQAALTAWCMAAGLFTPATVLAILLSDCFGPYHAGDNVPHYLLLEPTFSLIRMLLLLGMLLVLVAVLARLMLQAVRMQRTGLE